MYDRQKKWRKKAGFKSRAFTAYDWEYNAFKEACKMDGKGLNETLRELMNSYTRKHNIDIELYKNQSHEIKEENIE